MVVASVISASSSVQAAVFSATATRCTASFSLRTASCSVDSTNFCIPPISRSHWDWMKWSRFSSKTCKQRRLLLLLVLLLLLLQNVIDFVENIQLNIVYDSIIFLLYSLLNFTVIFASLLIIHWLTTRQLSKALVSATYAAYVGRPEIGILRRI